MICIEEKYSVEFTVVLVAKDDIRKNLLVKVSVITLQCSK